MLRRSLLLLSTALIVAVPLCAEAWYDYFGHFSYEVPQTFYYEEIEESNEDCITYFVGPMESETNFAMIALTSSHEKPTPSFEHWIRATIEESLMEEGVELTIKQIHRVKRGDKNYLVVKLKGTLEGIQCESIGYFTTEGELTYGALLVTSPSMVGIYKNDLHFLIDSIRF